MPSSIYDFEVETLTGEKRSMADYRGKVLLIVNTASKCGYTPQLDGLEKLYEKLKGEGFEVLGFPCNQFLNQDPGSNEEIGEFCTKNYGVSFPMHSKTEAIKWNFTKFLVDRKGRVVRRYATATKPEEIQGDILALLRQQAA